MRRENGPPVEEGRHDLAAAKQPDHHEDTAARGRGAPAAPFQVMPPLSAAEYVELRADIEAHGVQVPILVDDRGRVIDGHHRQRIAAQLKVPCPATIMPGYADAELRNMAFRLNANRRHLTQTQRREALAASLKADPALSDRQHAERVGVSHHTAGAVRGDLEGRGQIAHVEARTDSVGRQQPTKAALVPVVPGLSPSEVSDCLSMGDGDEQQFEAALTEAKADGDLSRTNVVSHLKAVPTIKLPRRPLPEQVRNAGWELEKLCTRISKLADDDRFGRYSRTDDARSQIARTKEMLRGLLARLDEAEGGSR